MRKRLLLWVVLSWVYPVSKIQRLSYWRTESGNEVNLIWSRGKTRIGFEIKCSKTWREKYNKGLNTLLDSGHLHKAYGVYTGDVPLVQGRIEVLPLGHALKKAQLA